MKVQLFKPHDFRESLEQSQEANDLPIWREMYQQAFPSMVAMVDHRQDGEHQRAGIDRSVILANSKQILIDEKVRFKAYDDICLEVWSDKGRRVPGWVAKPLRCDYIAYAVAPLGKGYLLPTVQLQSAWAKHGEQWSNEYFHPEAYNKRGESEWVTENVAVPVPVLFKAIGGCLRLTFEAIP